MIFLIWEILLRSRKVAAGTDIVSYLKELGFPLFLMDFSTFLHLNEQLEAGRFYWFYCGKRCVHFSEKESYANDKLEEKIEVKNKNRTNAYNSSEKNQKYKISENNLM